MSGESEFPEYFRAGLGGAHQASARKVMGWGGLMLGQEGHSLSYGCHWHAQNELGRISHMVVDASIVLSGQTRSTIPKSIWFITLMVGSILKLEIGDKPRAGRQYGRFPLDGDLEHEYRGMGWRTRKSHEVKYRIEVDSLKIELVWGWMWVCGMVTRSTPSALTVGCCFSFLFFF